MLSDLISRQAAAWFERPDCPARPVIDYIRARGFFRDAQIEAIQTYLFLKIQGGNRPLWQLFAQGDLMPGEDLSRLHISEHTRTLFQENTSARALFEFSRGQADNANSTANGSAKTRLPDLEKYLLDHGGEIDCRDVIQKMFYDVAYPDYVFSLPMGAGKTFLMAAFIYLDLYFAQNEPHNEIWAHNFILLVPSGLKSSIIPSLKTIENFDATRVLPEPAASNIKKLIRFEMLDQPRAANKSNKTRSPNAVKIAAHQPFEDLMGLVMVTNAEKVVLDRVQIDAQGSLIEESKDEKDKFANELRNLIGKIPNLQILIDEVHHAATDDIKLRQIVNNWQRGGNINGVLGFSGTPYLASPENVAVAPGLNLKFSQITNTVFYYPLTRAIEGFLKKPQVKTISELQPETIVRRGVEDFMAQYGTKVYSGGQTAKLAIYCGSIERLEQSASLLLEMKIAPGDILKYHRGNKTIPAPADAEREWKTLDTHLSKKRIVLLVQIGKEGWDCRSLTGVILSQKGDCPTNMVLQTSCRCLRQMDGASANGASETAGIWLNADNAKILDNQLKEEQNTSIEAINKLSGAAVAKRTRFSRIDRLKLPPVDFYQMRVYYHSQTVEEAAPQQTIAAIKAADVRLEAEQVQSGLKAGDEVSRRFLKDEEARGETADFARWLLLICKGSFNSLAMRDLRPFESHLRALFNAMTHDDNGVRLWSELYDETQIAARVRLAFHDKRERRSTEEIVQCSARLLIIEKLKDIAESAKLSPSREDAEQMRELDESGQSVAEYEHAQKENFRLAQETLKKQGINIEVTPPATVSQTVRNKDRSFHVVPYNMDSSFELEFLQQALQMESLQQRELELYFNGEGELTEFQIECFARASSGWNRIGKYTPDFLLVQRRDNLIYRALIVETKGLGFAQNFAPRRKFVEEEFLRINNDKFGYQRFDFLYLEDKMTSEARARLEQKIEAFFAD